MQAIETVTVGSGGAASITFSSIPDTYTDLKVVFSIRSERASSVSDTLVFRLNEDSSNQSIRALRGNGSSAESFTNTLPNAGIAPSVPDTFGSYEAYVPNYTSGVAKSFSIDAVEEKNGTTVYQQISAGLYNSTDAITSLNILTMDANIAEHSTATLYGILAGSDGTTTVT
jgi:hypothetical protein